MWVNDIERKYEMKIKKLFQQVLWWILPMTLLAGCGGPSAGSTLVPPTDAPTKDRSTATPPPMIAGGSWTTKAEMPTGRWNLSTSVVDGKIYAIGGAGPVYEALSTVEVYDPVTDTWMAKSPMPTAREGLSTSIVNGKIYAIGGLSGTSSSRMTVDVFSAVEEYDPATDTWSVKSPMPTARAHHYAHVVAGKIYIIGGASSGVPIWDPVFTIEVYDPATDSWAQKGEFLGGLRSGASSIVDGKIYIFGGSPESMKVYKYDPATDTWTQNSDLPTARDSSSASALDGKIYVFGGFFSSNVINAAEVYDPATDTWATTPEIPTGRVGSSSSVVDGKIYVIGGMRDFVEANKTVEVFEP